MPHPSGLCLSPGRRHCESIGQQCKLLENSSCADQSTSFLTPSSSAMTDIDYLLIPSFFEGAIPEPCHWRPTSDRAEGSRQGSDGGPAQSLSIVQGVGRVNPDMGGVTEGNDKGREIPPLRFLLQQVECPSFLLGHPSFWTPLLETHSFC